MIRINTIVLFVVLFVSSIAYSQRDAHLEFSAEIDGKNNRSNSFNIISVDTFYFGIANFYFEDGKFVPSSWEKLRYEEFKMYSDGLFHHKVYISEKDSLRISYSNDSTYVTYSGYRVRNKIKHFTALLDSGTIKQREIPKYDRVKTPCMSLHVMNTNFLLKDKTQSLSLDYLGTDPKYLRLKSDKLKLSQKSWLIYDVTPETLDTVNLIVTDVNGNFLYSESFIVVDEHTLNFKDVNPPSQNNCDKITTTANVQISRSKNQKIMLRSKNYSPSKFRFEIENGELVKNVNNVLEIKWGEEQIGSIIVYYEESLMYKQMFLIKE